MAAFTDYLETAVLNATLRNISFTSPANVYVSLFVGATTDALTSGPPNEVTVGGYARQLVGFGVPVSGQTSNTLEIVFPTAASTWGTVTHVAIFDTLTVGTGNALYHGPLATPKTVNSGDTFRFLPTQLVVGLD